MCGIWIWTDWLVGWFPLPTKIPTDLNGETKSFSEPQSFFWDSNSIHLSSKLLFLPCFYGSKKSTTCLEAQFHQGFFCPFFSHSGKLTEQSKMGPLNESMYFRIWTWGIFQPANVSLPRQPGLSGTFQLLAADGWIRGAGIMNASRLEDHPIIPTFTVEVGIAS